VAFVFVYMTVSSFSPGEETAIRVTHQEDSWYVEEPDTEGLTVCFFVADSTPETDAEEISVRVETYRQAPGDDTNYLTVELLDGSVTGSTDTNGDSEPGESSSNGRTPDYEVPNRDSYPERKLIEFDGSGDYVTIEAEIYRIEFVEKDNPLMPDMKGILKEDGSAKKLPFVVVDDVNHPYLDRGERFRFEGVKDHEYEHQTEIQALITEETSITNLDED